MFAKSLGILAGPLAMAFLAGAVLPFQAASNANMGRTLGHPFYGALVSLAVSAVAIVPLLALARAPAPAIGAALQGPWWLWIGGLLGAIYVGSAAALTPMIGAGSFLACVVAGQIVLAVVVDHYGWMGLAARPVDLPRILGVALILVGVALVQGLFTARAGAAIAP